jgi:hypothetical protein
VKWTETATLPTLGENVFDYQTPPDINLHIPAGTQPRYEAADVWKEFFLVEQTVTTYTLSIGTFEGGVVTADKTAYAENEAVTLTIAPDVGYTLYNISAHKTGDATTTVPLTGTGGNTRNFIMPGFAVTIKVTFRPTATTGTEVPAQAKALNAYTQNGHLYVTGITPGQPWRVYSITGTLVSTKTVATNEAELSLPTRGVYIVQSGNKSIKVVY